MAVSSSGKPLREFVRLYVHNRISELIGNQKGMYAMLSRQIGRNGSYLSRLKNSDLVPPLELIYRISILIGCDYKVLLKGVEYYYFIEDYSSPLFHKQYVELKDACLKLLKGSISEEQYFEDLKEKYISVGKMAWDVQAFFEVHRLRLPQALSFYEENNNITGFVMLKDDFFKISFEAFLRSDWYLQHKGIIPAESNKQELISIPTPIDIRSEYGFQQNVVDVGIKHFTSPGLYLLGKINGQKPEVHYLRNADEADRYGQITGKVKEISIKFD